jgi:molybdopterin synthase catalytic subunit
VRISVRLFAGLRERAGAERVEVELPEGASVGDLLAAMSTTAVGELPPRSCIVALNREYASPDEIVGAGDEVALVPPVSGGAPDAAAGADAARAAGKNAAGASAGEAAIAADASADDVAAPPSSPVRLVAISAGPLDLAAISAAVRDPRAGGVVIFEGVTREVEALDYEAYAEMAETKLRAIGEQVAAEHGLCAVALAHRVGRVPLSEPSVLVAASAAHRGEAFTGARALIDRVKAEAPIWKVELTPEGARRVEGTLPEWPT